MSPRSRESVRYAGFREKGGAGCLSSVCSARQREISIGRTRELDRSGKILQERCPKQQRRKMECKRIIPIAMQDQ